MSGSKDEPGNSSISDLTFEFPKKINTSAQVFESSDFDSFSNTVIVHFVPNWSNWAITVKQEREWKERRVETGVCATLK